MREEDILKSIEAQGFVREKENGKDSKVRWASPFGFLYYYPYGDADANFVHPLDPINWLTYRIEFKNHHLITKLSEVSDRLAEHLWPIFIHKDYQLKAKGSAVYAYCRRYPDPKLKGVILWENIFDGSPFNLSGFLELVKAVESLDKAVEDFNNK